MKFFCFFFLFVLSFVVSNTLFARTAGRGCNLGNRVAIQYLGMATYNGHADQKVYVYSASPPTIIGIVFGQGYSGYRCGYINIYNAGTRYNSATQQNVPYQAAKEITADYSGDNSHRCATAFSFSPNFISNQGGSEGYEADYRYNDPAYYADSDPNFPCNAPMSNLPIDDYTWILVSFIGIFGAISIRYKVNF
jgi:hypothetical protein